MARNRETSHETRDLGKGLAPGARHYRAFVGPPRRYDLIAALQFNLLTLLGLREEHFLLDIGCGSLRGGRLFIPYLLPERYFGIEPEQWLIDEGIEKELGKDVLNVKRPVFSNDAGFSLSRFNRRFDYILAQSIFSHAPEHQITKCLAEARQVMKPTAIFAATFFQGEENYTGMEWVYPDCVFYTRDHIVNLAEQQGLVCLPIEWHHPDQAWVLFLHPGYRPEVPVVRTDKELESLPEALRLCRERLARIEGHPYVKLGLNIRPTIRRLLPEREP
jgi:SAM-dependent methyltransferase